MSNFVPNRVWGEVGLIRAMESDMLLQTDESERADLDAFLTWEEN